MDGNLMWWFEAMAEIKPFKDTWETKDILVWLFCTLPTQMPQVRDKKGKKDKKYKSPSSEVFYVRSSRWNIQWTPQPKLQEYLAKVIATDWDVEKILRFFIKEYLDNTDTLAAQCLQSYLFKIVILKSRKIHTRWQREPWYQSRFSLWDISQLGLEFYSEASDFWAKYDKTLPPSHYGFKTVENKINDEVRDSINLNYLEVQAIKSSKYWILYNSRKKNLKEAVKNYVYKFDLESHLLVCQCFKEVYSPTKREKYPEPTKKQLAEMADLYSRLRKRSPELKQDESPVDARFIHQCLENSIKALYKFYERPRELSWDMNVGGEDSQDTTLGDIIPDERVGRKFEYLEMEEYFIDFYQKLDDEQRILLILSSGCELTTREMAAMDKYQCNASTISRKLEAMKTRWLKVWYDKNMADRIPGKSIEKAMKEPEIKKILKKLVDEIWKKNESQSYLLIYQGFQKVWQQLESPSQEILELHLKRKPFKEKSSGLSLTAAEEKKVEDVFQVLVSGTLQWLELELKMSLASYEPLIQKVSGLVDEFLIRTYQENLY